MKKIGIIGGTFDPIHNAHIAIAKCAYEQLNLDKVLFMPTYIPPHKRNNIITDENHRLKMTSLAIEDYPWAELSDMEILLGGDSYTARTLTLLDEKLSDTSLVFILGADSYLNLDTWYHPEIIFAHAAIACAGRDGVGVQELTAAKERYERLYKGHSYLLTMNDMPVSSHEIRQWLMQGRDVSQYIPPKVYEYIRINELY